MANSELTSRGLSLRDLLEKQDFPVLTSNIKKPDNLVASSGKCLFSYDYYCLSFFSPPSFHLLKKLT